MDETWQQRRLRGALDEDLGPGASTLGEVLSECLDSGSRSRRPVKDLLGEVEDPRKRGYRVRSPTNSERLNRALVELNSGAFKVHVLLWKWRGAPARGLLPFFTVHSLSRFCEMSRPTVRSALNELIQKGWIRPEGYNKHHKNTLFRLVNVREIPAPGPARPDRRGRSAGSAEKESGRVSNS